LESFVPILECMPKSVPIVPIALEIGETIAAVG
jgi:hypothetical protein